jgi:hypothetical protein
MENHENLIKEIRAHKRAQREQELNEKTMKVMDVYLIPKDSWTFRYGTGQRGKIIGVKMVTPPGIMDQTPRLCFVVEFPDGVIDYVAVYNVKHGSYDVATSNL